MIVAVLDTNVLVSGIIGYTNPNSTPGEIFRQWRDGGFDLTTSDAILRELHRVFEKPYFRDRVTDPLIHEMIAEVAMTGRRTEIATTVAGVASHAEDDLILATAISGNADVLVTGDRGLLELGTFHDTRILSPAAFRDLLLTNDIE